MAAPRSARAAWRRRSAALPLLAALLCACQLLPASAAPLMALDLGSEFLKVAVVKPGRTPISVVPNEMSKRKTTAAVAFVDGERLLGEEAAALGPRFPDRVLLRARDFLGRPANHSSTAALLADNLLPTQVEADPQRGTVVFKSHSGQTYSVEEVVASLVHYARGITQAAADGAAVLDCVITVPAFWGRAARQALVDAAELAGLNVLSLVNNHAAAALQFGIERDFGNRSERVVLFDMGAGCTEVALLRYSSFSVKELGKVKTFGQFEVEDVAWAEDTGGAALDRMLLDHFAQRFNEKQGAGGKDVRDNARALAKLRKAVKRTKEILSANSQAPLSVEELLPGVDLRDTITREEFEALAAPVVARAVAPLEALLARNGLESDDVAAVELLGGSSRVPAVKAALSAALGGRALDMHLDADEAVALGAALFAANLSTTFRLRKFGMADGVIYPVTFQLQAPEDSAADSGAPSGAGGSEDSAAAYKPRLLLPHMKRLPSKRVVHLPNATSQPLRFSLSYDTSSGLPLPPGVDSETLGEFELGDVAEVVARYNQTGKLSAHFGADLSGILRLDKAEAVVEFTEMVETQVPKKVNATANETKIAAAKPASGADSSGAGAADTSAASSSNSVDDEEDSPAEASPEADNNMPDLGDLAKKFKIFNTSDFKNLKDFNLSALKDLNLSTPQVEYETVLRPRQRTVRVPLNVSGPGWLQPGLTPEQKKASRKVLAELAYKDQEKREAAKAKNDLESYIIATRSQVEEDEALAKVAPAKARAAFLAQLTDQEDWLYGDGELEAAPAFRKALAKLREVGDPMFGRARELAARPAAAKAARAWAQAAAKSLASWRTTRAWLNATHLDDLQAQIEEYESWLTGEEKKQAKLKLTDEPVLNSADISGRLAPLKKVFTSLKNKKKPKAPKVTVSANATANGTDGGASAAANATLPEDLSEPLDTEQVADDSPELTLEGDEDLGSHDEL